MSCVGGVGFSTVLILDAVVVVVVYRPLVQFRYVRVGCVCRPRGLVCHSHILQRFRISGSFVGLASGMGPYRHRPCVVFAVRRVQRVPLNVFCVLVIRECLGPVFRYFVLWLYRQVLRPAFKSGSVVQCSGVVP